MSWQTPREAHFSLKGPFLARRDQHAGDLELKTGEVYTHQQFREASVSDRTLQHMYQAHWIDMAPDAEPAEMVATVLDDKGHRGPSPEKHLHTGLRAAHAALKAGDKAENLAAEHQDEQKAPDAADEREVLLHAGLRAVEALLKDQAEAIAGDTTPPVDQAEAGGATVQGDAATSPADTTLAAYRHLGFGKYHPVNAAGEKLDDKPLSKAAAMGFAARDAVPLLGQNGDPIAQE